MFEPIAIVGRGCVLPGASSPAELWSAVVEGRDLLSEAPDDRWGLPRSLALSSDPKHSRDRAWSARGGYVRGFDFAAVAERSPFRRPVEDLLALDPLFHWVLHAGREALREAGHDGRSARASVVMGNLSFPSSAMSRYAEHVWFADRPAVDPRNRFMSGLPAMLLAEDQGLRTGSALDAACASSLYALKLACDQLHDRTVDLALAGAVCRSDDLFIHVGFCALDAMSRTGRSRPFHRGADGLVPAEGAAFLALKRLDDAVAAGDRVFGVIRGVGLSNDGRGRGLLAPDSGGQVRALRSAWEGSGVDPARLSMAECHATGTPVGDAVEIETLTAFLGARTEPLPLGSLKSNLGHLITAAGAAGVLKVLSAMEHGVRPPTLHVEDPTPALGGKPFRLLTKAEPWEAGRPRVASVSAFGFGGNNAHVVLEEHAPSERRVHRAAAIERPALAVVAVAVRSPSGPDTASFAADLASGARRVRASGARVERVTLPLEKLKFPPRDLEQTLAQQTLLLDAAMEAAEAAGAPLPRDRTAVLVGSQSDPEVCRYGARWRLAGWHADADPAWLAAAKDAVVPVLESPGVVGNMPNIPANRISSQLDLGGPGFTIAAEELSGTTALALAERMLQAGEIDAAVVGAVDLSVEAVHAAAAGAVLPPRTPGDAAVALVLCRLADARAQGRPVLAVLGGEADDGALRLGAGGLDLTERFGAAHAASGLLHVAAAVLSVAGATRPDGAGSWRGARTAVVRATTVFAPEAHTVVVRAASEAPVALPAREPARRPLVLPSHPEPVRLPARQGAPVISSDLPRAPSLPSALDEVRSLGPTGFADPGDRMAPPPGFTTTTPTPTTTTTTEPAPQPAQVPVPAPVASRPAEIGDARGLTPGFAEAPAPASAAAPGMPVYVLAGMADLHRRIGAAHQAHLAQQAALQASFMELRARTIGMVLDRARTGVSPSTHAIEVPPPAPVPLPLPEPAPRPAPVAAPKPPPPAPKPPAPAPKPPTPAPVAPASTALVPHVPVSQLPGPKWSRQELEVLASDKISKVFGPMFSVQDAFPRQVRMPEPPLLLVDRVVGLQAEPGSMTTGVIWTETDVRWDSWYLHDGTMPAGVMIEAGQADLLLISWLGADFQNKGERVYRLLGCRLRYSGGLPRPGETLRYQIHVDGHANLGATRIFFFHSDCRDPSGANRLSVREGQAGFFSDAELAESGGILWTPETGEHAKDARVDPPLVKSIPRSYSAERVLAFANGDGFECFGKGYERLATHVRTPRIAPPPMSFWQRVTDLDPAGGPWKRGYLRAEQDVTPQDWFFQGHFKDDPCMPGTMMFEACLQASAFYLAALGFTLRKDGWTFEPVPDTDYDLKCRGQVIPSSKHLVYEVFVEELEGGPFPTLWADFLVTVDGLKAFHARRVGLRLRPDWPITSRADLQDLRDPVPVAEVEGFKFGYASLMACAWGKPSDAFGPMYRVFDQGRHCARLPGPPYHFMSRLTKIDGKIGGMQIGTSIELEYDVPQDEWYFDENGCRTMPYCVLLEAALQPCGWIACYVGSALTVDKDLFFRNLDGTATWTAEVLPTSGTLKTKAKITGISNAGGMIIESFDVECFLGDTRVYVMKTVFGFFPREALANQIGITPTKEDREALLAPSDFQVDLTKRPAKYCGGPLRLPAPMLLMLDRVRGFWPKGGKKGLGRLVSEKDVDPSEWFFKAHFFSDPVQPGSLGIEAMIQLLQFFMIETEMHRGMAAPRFEPLMMGRELSWKYRGQVIPENKVIRCEIDITEVGEDERGRFAICDAYLWVDELRIYGATGMGVRIVDDPTFAADAETVLDPAKEPWLGDHQPTWTVPALPAMSMVDRLAGAAKAVVPGEVIEVRDAKVSRWLALPGPVRTRTEVVRVEGGEVEVKLEAWRDAADERLSRFETVCTGTVVIAPEHPEAPRPLAALADAEPQPDPYAGGTLFHGPAFQLLRSLALGPTGSTAVLDAGGGAVPRGTLHQGLLDALTHAIPHDRMDRWSSRIGADQAAYPYVVERLRFFAPAPTDGEVQVEARFEGFADDPGRHPRVKVQAIDLRHERVWCELLLTEVLLPKGPIGSAAPGDRLAFLRDHRFVPGLALSKLGEPTVPDPAAIRASDWLPGTVAAVYGSGDPQVVAAKDHVAQLAEVHPGTVELDERGAVSTAQPLTRWPLEVTASGVRSTGAPALDLEPVTAFWDRWFGVGRWPVEDLYYGLARRFVRRVHLTDPDVMRAMRGRSMLFLGNHQVGVESLMFSVLASGLQRVSTVTLAKAEHRATWLGKLIAHNFGWPGVRDPEVITFFDRDDKASLPAIIGRLAAEMAGPGKSVMVHVEGTRSLECRTPVVKMSGAFLDMAITVKAPVVPIRFVGALPVEPLAERLEFPVGMGVQDLWIGAPIPAEELAAVPYKERKDRVIAAMNELGPPKAEERPFPGDPAFAAKVAERVARTGVDEPHAVLMEVLAEVERPHEDTARILEGDRTGALVVGPDPKEGWVAELARRLYGPRGAKVREG